MKTPRKPAVEDGKSNAITIRKPFLKPVKTTRAAIRRAVKKVIAAREAANV